MKNARNYVVFMLCFLGFNSLVAHTISGSIVESGTDKPLVGANVIILGEGKGASCDLDGNFFISDLSEGMYKMLVSRVGYKPDTVDISIPDDVYLKVKLHSHAQTLQPVIITANRTKQNLQESPVTVTVMDKAAVDDANAFSMDDLMQNAPGVTMSRESIALRNCSGFSYGVGSRVLLMVDGVPMLSGDAGQIKWDALGLTHIKQIEMVKNAGSALYGSGALGGVINIITEEPEQGSHFNIRTDFGIWDKPYYEEWQWTDETQTFHGINVKHTNTWNEKWTSVLSLSEKMDDGYRMLEYSRRATIFGKLKYAPNATQDFTVSANGSYNDHGQYLDWKGVSEALSVPEEELEDEIFSRRLNANAIYNNRNIDKKRFITVKAHTFIDDWDSRSYDADDTVNYRERLYASSSKTGLNAQLSYNGFDKHHFTVGGESTFSTVRSKLYSNRMGYGAAIYGQDEIKTSNPFTFSLGARADFFDVPDAKTYYMVNPKAGIVYQAANNIAIRSSLGTGYRVPTMAELFTRVTVSAAEIFPNPDLDAEKSYSAEIGGNIIMPWSTFDIAFFSTWYNDMIEPKATEGTKAKFINLDESRVMGTEMTLNMNVKYASLSANYLFTDSRDIKTNEKLSYRPEHNFNLSGRINYMNHLALTAAWRYKSERTFELYPNSPSVPEKILDIGHSFDFGDYFFSVKVNNVFQYHYSEVEKGIEPIRNFVFSAGMDI